MSPLEENYYLMKIWKMTYSDVLKLQPHVKDYMIHYTIKYNRINKIKNIFK